MDASDGPAVQALLDEQAALRRVATLVASAGDPARVFSTVTAEVGGLLGAQTANMVRYRHDGTADVIGGWNEPGVPSVPGGREARARRGDAGAEDLPQWAAGARG